MFCPLSFHAVNPSNPRFYKHMESASTRRNLHNEIIQILSLLLDITGNKLATGELSVTGLHKGM